MSSGCQKVSISVCQNEQMSECHYVSISVCQNSRAAKEAALVIFTCPCASVQMLLPVVSLTSLAKNEVIFLTEY